MSDTNFVLKSTVIMPDWLNDVNKLRYGAGVDTRGAALLQFMQANSGAAVRDAQSKMRELASPLDYGAVGNGVVDDSTAMNAYFAANKSCTLLGPQYNFKCLSPVVLQSGTYLDGRGGRMFMGTANTQLLDIAGKSNIEIHSCDLTGFGSDRINSDSSKAIAIYGNGSEVNIKIHNNTFTNFSYTSLRAINSSGVKFVANKVDMSGVTPITPGVSGQGYGVLIDSGSADFLIEGNEFIGGCQGIRVELSGRGVINANYIHNVVGQHGMYLGTGLYKMAVSSNIVDNVALQGIKLQHTDAAGRDCTSMSFTGNVVEGSGSHGFLIYSSTAYPQTYHIRDLTFTGNVSRTTTLDDGFHFGAVIGGTITGNTSELAASYAIALDGVSSAVITGNMLKASGLTGIRDLAACSNNIIRNNMLTDVAQLATVGDRFGIYLQASTLTYVDFNVISDQNTKMEYGLYVTAGQIGMGFRGNVVLQATGTGARFVAATSCRYYQDNYFAGSGGAVTDEPVPPTVASATALTLPTGWDVYRISGNTAITSIVVAGHVGRMKTFIFQDAPTVTKGSNLKMPSNFVASADDTWGWVTDGTNVYETFRAVNS